MIQLAQKVDIPFTSIVDPEGIALMRNWWSHALSARQC